MCTIPKLYLTACELIFSSHIDNVIFAHQSDVVVVSTNFSFPETYFENLCFFSEMDVIEIFAAVGVVVLLLLLLLYNTNFGCVHNWRQYTFYSLFDLNKPLGSSSFQLLHFFSTIVSKIYTFHFVEKVCFNLQTLMLKAILLNEFCR